ncbi:hypothetical protein NHH03_13205 [Stieleria sp. TO1_6]|nr:hypothetical protein [Stieleria tagensis]
MDDSELERMPNPFSTFADSRAKSRKNLFSAVKFLGLAVLLFCAVTFGQVHWKQLRVSQLLDRFQSRSAGEKLAGLRQLQASGAAGIDGIVAAVADDNPQVSKLAAETLSEMKKQWLTLPTSQRTKCRQRLSQSLARVCNQLDQKNDHRWPRLQQLAQACAQELLESAPGADSGTLSAADQQSYQTLMQIVANAAAPALPVAQATTGPLPIDSLAGAGTHWTDWPPTSSAPTLFRRSVTTLSAVEPQQVVLSQTEQPQTEQPQPGQAPSHQDQPEPELVRPQFQAAATLAEQTRQQESSSVQSTEYWIAQLQSTSRRVRLHAVVQLGQRDDPHAIRALRDQLRVETDHTVAFRIRERLEQ